MAKKTYNIEIVSAYWMPAFAQLSGVKLSNMQLKAISIDRGRSK